jgi:hypothetical protein
MRWCRRRCGCPTALSTATATSGSTWAISATASSVRPHPILSPSLPPFLTPSLPPSLSLSLPASLSLSLALALSFSRSPYPYRLPPIPPLHFISPSVCRSLADEDERPPLSSSSVGSRHFASVTRRDATARSAAVVPGGVGGGDVPHGRPHDQHRQRQGGPSLLPSSYHAFSSRFGSRRHKIGPP